MTGPNQPSPALRPQDSERAITLALSLAQAEKAIHEFTAGKLDAISYVLRQHGSAQVSRDSSGQYVWARHAHGFRAVISRKPDSFEMDEMLPGDLLFWIGTYATDHDRPVTHTMLYLGTEKASGGKIMIGSSDGRTYHGQKHNGVSVFDFTMPRTPTEADPRSTSIGYARILCLRD